MKKNLLLQIGVLVIATIVGFYILRRPVKVVEQIRENIAETDKAVTFVCPERGKFIKATFHLPEDKTVDIELSDGRKIILPHAMSGSGARYANADESFVFWNKGDTAFIEEGGNMTFKDCVENKSSN